MTDENKDSKSDELKDLDIVDTFIMGPRKLIGEKMDTRDNSSETVESHFGLNRAEPTVEDNIVNPILRGEISSESQDDTEDA